jgi:hypothetical protein
MHNPELVILLVVTAVLAGLVAGLVVAFLAYDGSLRKAILVGLGTFGATTVAVITVEGELGLL